MSHIMSRRVAARQSFRYLCQMEDDDKLDLIWGVENIAQFIGRTYQQTHHMLSKGSILGRRVGERWVVD